MTGFSLKYAFRWCLILFGVQLATACAPTVNMAQLKQVKKIAVVGYTATIERPKDDNVRVAFLTDRSKAQSNAVFAYEQLGTALDQHLGWDVVEHSDLIANADYKATYDAIQNQNVLTSFQTKMGSLSSDYYPEGVMWASFADGLSKEQRAKLCEALGVDAIATALLRIKPRSSSSFLGASSTTFGAQVTFRLWNANLDEEIWKDLAAMGDESEGASNWNFGGLRLEDDEQKAFLQAVGLGYVELLKRYDEARQAAKEAAKQ